RVKAGEKIQCREDRRNQVDAFFQSAPIGRVLFRLQTSLSLQTWKAHQDKILAIGVTPPRTCIPSLTSNSEGALIVRSVREPNFIMPKRSPARTASPSFFQQTIRRANTPAICVQPIVKLSPSIVNLFCFFSSLSLLLKSSS